MIDYEVLDGLCVLRLDWPPVNAISLAALAALRAAVARANADHEVRAIAITGSPAHFSAGADLADFQAIRSGDDAVRMATAFQEAFQEIEDSARPVIAAVAGNVLGGALELAMACHHRIAAEGSRFGLPEIKLGINPGAGGTQRLPRLVGPAAAVAMLLTGELIDARRALALGLIDHVCPGGSLLDCARQWAVSNAPQRRTRERTEKIEDREANSGSFAAANEIVAALRPEIIAGRTILAAVRAGVEESFAAGLRAEREGFRQCMATRATQNKIYIFTATRLASKIADDNDSPVDADSAMPAIARAAVVGMGTMGTGIVQALITAGVSVVAYDESASALERGAAKIRASLAGRVAQGKLAAGRAEEIAGRLALAADRRQLADAELVIESVFEDVDAKRSAIADVEAVCRPATIIASNTSTISLDVLAGGMRHPERLLGLHFFNPAQRMPLVEVIRRAATPPPLAAALVRFAKKIGKTPVLVNNREGFLVNRLFIPYLKEAFWLLEAGAEPEAVDAAMLEFGFAMGPFVLIDMAGLDILVLTDAVLRGAFPHHGGPAEIAVRLVQAGHRGQKSGSGVYLYEKGGHQPRPNPAAAEIIAAARQRRGPCPGPMPAEEITRRLVLRVVNEAFYVLEEGLCQRPSDLDVAMVLGTGLADFRGGVVRYAQDLGLDRVRGELEDLAAQCGERYAPGKLLQGQ
jgi:3-hydroxyacyl-CoA dehydrogenase